MTWEPIETAPTDGETELLFWIGTEVVIGAAGSISGGIVEWVETKTFNYETIKPTHWARLPAPPDA